LGLDRLGALEDPQDIGPVRPTPGSICMREQVFSERIGGTGVRHSFPVIASDQFSTYVVDRAEMVAELWLRARVHSCRWSQERCGFPGAILADRADPLRVPAVFGQGPQIPVQPGEAEWSGEIPLGTQAFRLPGWIERAWPILDADNGLDGTVNAVYEGMRLGHEYPSLAHLTFVAAIEGFGVRFVDDTLRLPSWLHS
jgi:hypothetical protein